MPVSRCKSSEAVFSCRGRKLPQPAPPTGHSARYSYGAIQARFFSSSWQIKEGWLHRIGNVLLVVGWVTQSNARYNSPLQYSQHSNNLVLSFIFSELHCWLVANEKIIVCITRHQAWCGAGIA